MKKNLLKVLTFAVVLLISALFASCSLNCIKGSGHTNVEDRKVNYFTKLRISGAYKIILKQDSSLSLHITADDNLMRYIHTETDGDWLKIYSKKNLCTSGQIIVNIGVRNLDEIKGSGAIEISSDGTLNVHDIAFRLSGASKADLDLHAANVTTKGTGATEITLRGQASTHDVDLSGSGKLHALDFVVGRYNIETTGASHCQINVLQQLDIHSTGASDIEYRGNPATINNSKSGASSLTKVD